MEIKISGVVKGMMTVGGNVYIGNLWDIDFEDVIYAISHEALHIALDKIGIGYEHHHKIMGKAGLIKLVFVNQKPPPKS